MFLPLSWEDVKERGEGGGNELREVSFFKYFLAKGADYSRGRLTYERLLYVEIWNEIMNTES